MTLTHRWILVLLAIALVMSLSCTGNDLDDGDGPDVVLLIDNIDAAILTSEAEASQVGTCTVTTGQSCVDDFSCPFDEGCVFPQVCVTTISAWSATLRNSPKSSLAGADSSPFNDIVMDSVVVVYDFIDPGIPTFQATIGLASTTIPADSSAAVDFFPIAFDDLTAAMQGRTANLSLFFRGHTVEGVVTSETAAVQMFIEGCVL